MGCRSSKDEVKVTSTTKTENIDSMAEKIDYKSRFERKMCLAKETPEPIFDLSDCNLKEIPAGVFIHCRILRKEILNLSKNQIQSLHCNNNNGLLSDLSLLQVLDLRFNKIKHLPDEIFRLENLRELLVSNNQLTKLPRTIKSLKYLELIDVSYNNLQAIEEINCMPSLRILNICGNHKLKRLPETLATCDNLCDLVFDEDAIEWPTSDVVNYGTSSILKFLLTGDVDQSGERKVEVIKDAQDALLTELAARDNFIKNQENLANKHIIDQSGYGNENALLEQIQKQQQKQKQQLLRKVLMQQNEADSLVNKLQEQKDSERNKLIRDILQAEDNATLVIDKFLALKYKPDNALIEKERLEEERLLERLHLEHSDLRKQEIIATMIAMLQDEETKIQQYQKTRDASSIGILEREHENSEQLGVFYENYQKNRNEIIEKICEDEELQKQAVAAFISKNDARSWGLVEQLKIIEVQLANMTQLEIERKKHSSEEQVNELAEKRLRLTYILMDLLEQQDRRKNQLLDTLSSMEAQKSEDEQDFWLLQYQRLLDSQPLEFSTTSNSIDPLLGYNFLVNGVIHCLPFLQKFWLHNDVLLENLRDEDLIEAGIRSEADRFNILKSIRDFIHEQYQPPTASAPYDTVEEAQEDETKDEIPSKVRESITERSNTIVNNTSECVICMEECVKVIFLPCGHMCCCLNCQLKVEICPMCRAAIERKIKVIQS